LFDGVNLRNLGYTCARHVPSPRATHIVLTRTTAEPGGGQGV
jgi:hypothetical protein